MGTGERGKDGGGPTGSRPIATLIAVALLAGGGALGAIAALAPAGSPRRSQAGSHVDEQGGPLATLGDHRRAARLSVARSQRSPRVPPLPEQSAAAPALRRSGGAAVPDRRSQRRAGIAPSAAGTALAALGRLGEVAPLSGKGQIASERARQSGVSLTPSTTKPYWACPQSACEAIIDPPAHLAAGRWVLPGSAKALEGSGQMGGYDPQDLQSAYGVPTGGGEAQQRYEESQTIALVDVGGHPHIESDLAEYRKQYGLPSCTKAQGCLRIVNQQGEEASLPPQSGEWELETSLDLEMASATCPHCHLLLVESNVETLASLAASANTAARLGATEISNSYGLPEEGGEPLLEPERESQPPGCGETRCEQLEADYNHPGVVVTVSAGDAGYDNYLRGGRSPLFPAVSANVIAVGGTALHKTSEGRKWQESVWWEPERSLGTGSGCSAVRPKPSWQQDAGCAHRTDNDIAAVAACATPVSIYSTYLGGWENVCGTSVSAPLLAGIEAHARESGGAVPTADAAYQERTSLYTVTSGRNDSSCSPEYLCSAESREGGYDGPAGNGTPASGPVRSTGEAPSVRTEPPTAGNTLNAVVDPNGLETTYCFQYGTTTSYGACAPSGEASAGSGTAAEPVSQSLEALAAGVYHYRLVAHNSAGTSYGEDRVLDTAPPTVSGVEPRVGYNLGGAAVKISGSNFVGVAAVRFGAAAATSFKVLSETAIEAISPPGSETVDVTVENAGGRSATGEDDRFTYVPLPSPKVTVVTPNVGRTTGGTPVRIAGAYFYEVKEVKFGTSAAVSFKARSEEEIEALAPAGSGTVDVTVATPAGTSAIGEADRFTFEESEKPSGATTGWQTLVDLTTHAGPFPQPSVAMDARGDAAAIWQGSGGEEASFRPTGASWQEPVVLSSGGTAYGRGRIAIDPAGESFAAWDVGSGSAETVQAAVRPPGGSWQPAVDLSSGCRQSGFQTRPHLAVDGLGDAIVAWHCYEESGGVLKVLVRASYRPAKGSFEAPATLAEAVIPNTGFIPETLSSPSIVFDSQGNAYAGWYDQPTRQSEVALLPAGGSWQTPTPIAREGGTPELAADGHGNAYALLREGAGLAVAYHPAGGVWQAPVEVVAPSSQGVPEGPPRLVVNQAGEEALIWFIYEGGYANVEAARRPPGGNWRVPVVLASSATDNGTPTIAIDAQGDEIAAWLVAPTAGNVLEAARFFAGSGWHAPQLISGGDTNGVFEPDAATTPQGNAVVLWEDHQSEIQAAGYDAGPQLEALSIPSVATAGQQTAFSVSPLGVWAPVSETKWEFGDGTSASGTSVSHAYATPGTYEVTVESKDADGQKSRASGTIHVLAPPPTVTAVAPDHGPPGGGTSVTITGTNFSGATAVKFGSASAGSFRVESETTIKATSPSGSGTVDVSVQTPSGTSALSAADHFTYEAIERAEYKSWVLSGSITDKRLGQAITLPAGSTFNGQGEVSSETGLGSVKGSISIPPFTATIRLFDFLPVSLGMALAEVGTLEGLIESSSTVPGDETLSAPLSLSLRVTSVGLLGLVIPTDCATAQAVSLALADTLTREELLTKGWAFTGLSALPRFKCEGGFLGHLFGQVLSGLLSGTENPFTLAVNAPGG